MKPVSAHAIYAQLDLSHCILIIIYWIRARKKYDIVETGECLTIAYDTAGQLDMVFSPLYLEEPKTLELGEFYEKFILAGRRNDVVCDRRICATG
jgi:hypothetical protein